MSPISLDRPVSWRIRSIGLAVLSHVLHRRWIVAVLAAGFIADLPVAAQAHVKWFAAYDLTAPPRSPTAIWSSDFSQLALLALFLLWAASRIEMTGFGRSVTLGIDLLTEPFRLRTDALLRAGLAVFFVALWTHGNIILTPELVTDQTWVEWLQAAIAAGLLWRPGILFSGLGIFWLFGYGIACFGWFHMMDYPIFLGFAGYCVVQGTHNGRAGMLTLDLVRWSVAITLMWASVEKWGYPEWTFPLLDLHPDLSMGFGHPFFMTAAGMVEFGFAFALIWTPLVRRISAAILGVSFISAIFEFGKIDAIGHLPIIAALMVVVIEPGLTNRWARPARLPACFGLALAGFVVAYCAAHMMLVPRV